MAMTGRTTNSARELAHRAGDGIDVSLHWDERTNRVTIRVYDARADEGFEIEVDGRHALDAYRHPFAYATGEQASKTVAATGSR